MSSQSIPPSQAWRKQYQQLAQWTMQHLVNRTDVWGQYVDLERRTSGNIAFTQPRKDRRGKDHLTEQHLGYHYIGKRLGLVHGIHATSPQNTSRFLVLDIDLHNEVTGDSRGNWELVCKLDACIQRLGLASLIEDSNGNGGYHIWIIFRDPAPTKAVYTLGGMLLKQAGAPEDTELFPKQAQLQKGEIGHWIRLPGRHHTREHWSRFYQDGQWVDGEAAVKYLLEAPLNDPQMLVDILTTSQENDTSGLTLPSSNSKHIQECQEYLDRLSPQRADTYDTWLQVGQALHDVDDSPEMLAIWDRWSQQSDKYRSGECQEKWAGFQQGRGLTIHSLRRWANEDDPPTATKDRRSQVQILIDIARSAAKELWHAPDGITYITLGENDRYWHRPIHGEWLPKWLIDRYAREKGIPPAVAAIESAIKFLDSQAELHGPEYPTFLRVATHDDLIFVDLGDRTGDVVEISATGWRITANPPVRFIRPLTLRPLPRPAPNGSVEALRPFLNVCNDDDFRLVVAYLLMAFRGKGPFPILNFEGEQGSAKSMHTRIVRTLIDPALPTLRTLAGDERDLMIAASSNYVLAYDNISYLSNAVSDALCRMATGGGFGTRKLYTDRGEVVFDSNRPIIINGITELATRPDLRNRVLLIMLSAIPDEKRKDEEEITQSLTEALPKILGGLFSAVSCALLRYPTTRLPARPRMADFARWVTAAEPALGWAPGSFLAAYQYNQKGATVSAVENDTVAHEVFRFATKEGWTGTATDLLQNLNRQVSDEVKFSREWPRTPRGMGGRLRRVISDLRQVGVEVTTRRNDARLFEIVRVSDEYVLDDPHAKEF